MKVALIGASGNVGQRLLAELPNRGHEVTGIVRHPEKLPPREGLTAKRGDINDEARLAPLLGGHVAVREMRSGCGLLHLRTQSSAGG